MARQSQDDSDKALWLTLAQSWVRLAEHVADAEASREPHAAAGGKIRNFSVVGSE
jgi:hypothetical protein